jgi:ribosome-associated translation inhibitor RaiA
MELEVRFRGIPPSEALEARIRERAAQLERLEPGIIHCRVWVDRPHHRHHQGDLYRVHVELTGVGGVTEVTRNGRDVDHSHEDAFVAVRDAFDAARRRLEDLQRRMRGAVKAHPAHAHGAIVSLDDAGGTVERPDGSPMHFSREVVAAGQYDELAVGELVWFMFDGERISEMRVLGR